MLLGLRGMKHALGRWCREVQKSLVHSQMPIVMSGTPCTSGEGSRIDGVVVQPCLVVFSKGAPVEVSFFRAQPFRAPAAANSHSASVGISLPAQRAYAWASA